MIHHISSAGSGRPVVLVHGNSFDGSVWSEQFSDPALAHLQLIAVDLPGHGRSPRNPADVPYRVDDMAAALSDFLHGMEDPVLVGHSLGGHVCIRALARAPQVRQAMIFGTPPLSSVADLGQAYLPHPAMAYAYKPDLTPAEALTLTEAYTWSGCPHVHDLVRIMLHTDPRVRGDIAAEIGAGHIPNEQQAMRASPASICVANGASDPFMSLPYLEALAPELFWEGRVQSIPQAGHFPQLQQPAALNALLLRFLDQ